MVDATGLRQFVDEQRARCLWFYRANYYPATHEQIEDVLRLIEHYGDRRVLPRVAEFRRWLSHRSNETSATT